MCDKIPNEIYILGNQPQPKVNKCIKKGNSWFCDGDEGGFWKLNGEQCRDGKINWFRCLTPFVKGKNGEVNYSDYSNCVLTNYPYYLTRDGTCKVKDLQGNTVSECNNDDCCEEGKVCDSLNCLGYKTSDRFLLSNTFNYKCDNGRCVQTEYGKGDYTNPFCDYQCPKNYYQHNFACVDGVCKQVSNPQDYPVDKLYDNPYCDGHCPSSVSFNCNKESKTCEKVEDKSGEYPNFTACLTDCIDPLDTPQPPEVKPKKDMDLYIFGGIIIFNIILLAFIFLILLKKK